MYAGRRDFCPVIEQATIDIAQLINRSGYWDSAIYYMLDTDQHHPKNLLEKTNNLDPTKQDAIMSGLQRLRNQGLKLGKQKTKLMVFMVKYHIIAFGRGDDVNETIVTDVETTNGLCLLQAFAKIKYINSHTTFSSITS